MKSSEIKKHILAFLAREYEKGNSGMINLEPVATRLGIPFKNVRPIISMLHQQGVLETVVGEQHASLTSHGISVALPLDPAVPRQTSQTVNFNGPISQSAVAMDQGAANVVVYNTQLEHFISNLTQSIDQAADISQDKKLAWKESILEWSKHPAIIAALSKLLGA